MKKRFSARLRNRFHYLSALLLLPVAGIIVFFIIGLRTSDLTLRLAISSLAVIVIALPTLVLHCSYLIKSNGIALEVEGSKYSISAKGRIIKTFVTSDLAYVTVFKRHKKIEQETGMYYGTWYNYYFVELNFADGDIVRLPCLLFRNLSDVPFEFSISDRAYPVYFKKPFQVNGLIS